mmetsp:Transcript_24199/g.68553  ORF Transcript_24199/g.68553 Transcript_24199/m.68553 type:complete len:210 (+) Transcript_24199:108-737(+)
MNHINKSKTSDGTGRDSYILNDSNARYGTAETERGSKVHSHKLFKHWELRAPPEVELSPRKASPRGSPNRRGAPSLRRGGAGWLPSVHMHDSRRVEESFASKSLSSSSMTTPRASQMSWGLGESTLSTLRLQGRFEELAEKTSPGKGPPTASPRGMPFAHLMGNEDHQVGTNHGRYPKMDLHALGSRLNGSVVPADTFGRDADPFARSF